MKYDEGREECLTVYDEEKPLESAKRLAREIIGATASVELQMDHYMHEFRVPQKHEKNCTDDQAELERAYRRALRTRKEARNIRRNLRFALDALQRGETATFVDFMRRRAKFSSEDESTLEFHTFVIAKPIEPSEYEDLLERLTTIDAGSGSLH